MITRFTLSAPEAYTLASDLTAAADMFTAGDTGMKQVLEQAAIKLEGPWRQE